MSGRRMKVKIQPNIGPLGKKKPKPKEVAEVAHLDVQPEAAGHRSPLKSPIVSPKRTCSVSEPDVQPGTAGLRSPVKSPVTSPKLIATEPDVQLETIGRRSPLKYPIMSPARTSTANELDVRPETAGHRSPLKSPLMSPRRTRTVSENVQDLELSPKFARKVFTGTEELNTTTMTLSDLVSWNPRNEKKLHWLQPKDANKDIKSESSIKSEAMSREMSATPGPQPHQIAAPQLKINADGTIAIDETSLVVRENPEDQANSWEVVDEDRVVKKISSTSFRKRVWRKGTPWTEQETEMFYELIQSVGTDFGLMHQFFPTRARSELKAKYNFEKRRNADRLDMVLSNPSYFDESLETRAQALADNVEKERQSKLDAKRKRSRKVKFEDEDERSGSDIEEATAVPTSKKRVITESDEETDPPTTNNGAIHPKVTNSVLSQYCYTSC
ncbi:hypothetical protein QR680_008427 [Steinernema hermaphroditum]|uniref:Myb-like domain-containing protein n=1 Tax=Steinernema hermaphroditum TaxID=289476 RepID=A0AA39IIY3_9BILA|nr:hypothetical protein QR680_008427 [Steinernema hermaphroditum]